MKEHRDQIIEICKQLHSRNLLAAADGNVSLRLSDQEILITPTGLNKAFLQTEDLAIININNEILSGYPSGERLMHLEVYRNCPQAKAVVHAHPPTAIAWSLACPDLKELPKEHLSELILAAGRIPIVPYARPGTEAMGVALKPFLIECRLMILARHGGLCWGESLQEAYNGLERLEHICQILKSSVELVKSINHQEITSLLRPLPDSEIRALIEIRKKMGHRIL